MFNGFVPLFDKGRGSQERLGALYYNSLLAPLFVICPSFKQSLTRKTSSEKEGEEMVGKDSEREKVMIFTKVNSLCF